MKQNSFSEGYPHIKYMEIKKEENHGRFDIW